MEIHISFSHIHVDKVLILPSRNIDHTTVKAPIRTRIPLEIHSLKSNFFSIRPLIPALDPVGATIASVLIHVFKKIELDLKKDFRPLFRKPFEGIGPFVAVCYPVGEPEHKLHGFEAWEFWFQGK
ncbi:hypothetical protein HG530_008266 [Fusarium avenaceum]|nr:hypothetical protein HG530_008266 [Fusarium avenaceum]